jgi:bifunctional DNA-binding transcriptional regulator/antitoxin component of YhaV-PrlF toxin-antitoxin module
MSFWRNVMERIITVDESGDFKIPSDIKDSLELKKDDKLFVFDGKDYIIIRKMKQSSLSERYTNLSNTVAKKFEKKGVNEADVSEAIRWARK